MNQMLVSTHNLALPVGGKIRPGIQVLTAKARENPEAVRIYQEMENTGASFQEIETAIAKACKVGPRDKFLTPRNVPYFTVHKSDFSIAGVAEQILDLYATDDPVHGRQLFSFPVIFPFEDPFQCIPHQFMHWKASELAHWSDCSTGMLRCYTRGEITVSNDRNRRGKKQWGGRPQIDLRQCDPNACDEFSVGECKLSGDFKFYIPGIPGAGIIEIPHTSFYALQRALATLQLVNGLAGRISGTLDGQPMFVISKKEDDVSRIDWSTGKPTRSRQFIITLTSTIDVGRMFVAREQAALPAPHDAPVQQIAAPPQQITAPPPVQTGPVGTEPPAPTVHPHDQEAQAIPVTEPPTQNHEVDLGALVDRLREVIREKRIPGGKFNDDAKARFGQNWIEDPNAVAQLLREVEG